MITYRGTCVFKRKTKYNNEIPKIIVIDHIEEKWEIVKDHLVITRNIV